LEVACGEEDQVLLVVEGRAPVESVAPAGGGEAPEEAPGELEVAGRERGRRDGGRKSNGSGRVRRLLRTMRVSAFGDGVKVADDSEHRGRGREEQRAERLAGR